MMQDDQALLVRLKGSGLEFVVLAAGREKDLEAVRLLRAVKERKEQQKELF